MSWVPPLPPARAPSWNRGLETKMDRKKAERKTRKDRIHEEVANYGRVPLASVEATSVYLGHLHPRTTRRLIERGKLEAVEIGTRVMVKTDSAQRLAGVAK
jgi:hypothetical protein